MPSPPSLPPEASQPAPSLVGQATSAAKLRGEVYTPLEVARGMVRRMRWPEGGSRLLDPACGDGVFLEAAMEHLVELDLPPGRAQAIVGEHMQGWDAHGPAIQACRARLVAASERLGLGGAIPRLAQRDALPDDGQRFDAVLGNPPYLEAKRMPAALKAHVKACCPVAASGAFDLYGAFVERGFSALAPGGELCFIIPNRFLVTAYARRLRKLLLERAALRVVDLSTSRIFADAAVYPVVLLAQQGAVPSYRVERWERPGGIELSAATLGGRLDGLLPLPPSSAGGRSLLVRSLEQPRFEPVGRRLDLRWCVSFHRAGLRDEFVFTQRPESPHARRFLGGGRWRGNREVEPFGIRWGGGWIDYDMQRARDAGNPLPPPEVHAAPKVVICQNARRARVALDREGLVLKDTFLSMRCREPGDVGHAWLEWAVLVLNSRLFHYLYEHLYGGTRKGGGYLHFLGRYLDPMPIPAPPEAARVRALHDALEAGEGDIEAAEALVRQAWGVTPAEAEALDAYSYPAA
jgi:hypothetical protein